jgi:hypothetical protein
MQQETVYHSCLCFQKKDFRDHFLRGKPVGCIGAGNVTGWLQEEEFLTFIEHFAKHAKPTKGNSSLTI